MYGGRAEVGAGRLSLEGSGYTLISLDGELCYMIELEKGAAPLSAEQSERLQWLIAETFEPQNTRAEGSFLEASPGATLVEVRPVARARA